MLHILSVVSLALAGICALWIAFDLVRHPQPMWIMNLAWPLTALYLGPVALWGYIRFGRAGHMSDFRTSSKDGPPNWHQVALATSHCGAGCVLGDILVEFTLFAFSITLFGSVLWAGYVWDLCAAWLFGIGFQYFSIQPMRHLPVPAALAVAIKADTLSILAFQAGMYAWMALVYFLIFPSPHLKPSGSLYWFMMQIAMAFGFLTSFPMNRWLLLTGRKERMG